MVVVAIVLDTILDHTYTIGKKVADGFQETMHIFCDDYLPQCNYTAKLQSS